MIQLKTNPTDKVIELGGGSSPLVRPNVDVRICHDAKGNRTVDFTADFHQPLPIQSNEWDGVFSQFAIEHIAYPKMPQFIAEVFRILKPGGKAVIVTANTEAQLKWALEHPEGWDGKDMFESASCKLFGDQRHGEREGDPNPNYDSHKCYFSSAILGKLFTEAGFENIKLTPYGVRDTDIVVEAVKPKYGESITIFAEKAEEVKKGYNVSKIIDVIQEEAKQAAREVFPPTEVDPEMEADYEQRKKEAEERLRKEHGGEIGIRWEGPLPVIEHTPESAKRSQEERRGVPSSPSYQPEKLFDRTYFNGGVYKPFYWDYPCHELTARHVLSRKPESVLELGCARGYVLKRLQDAGVMAKGIDVSKHCYMTRVVEGILQADFTSPLTWGGEKHADLCFSIAVLDHIPEEFLPAVFAEMERTCERGLHGINFGPQGDDKTRVTIHPKEWWQLRLPRGHEVVDKNELEGGQFPEDVFRGDGKVKLNLGCAQTMFHHGWTNIDIHDLGQWAQGNGYQYQRHDLRNGIPWGTGDVSLVYCGHMLEHLSYKEGLTFLRECRRVIKPDGAMRFIVPDAKLLMGMYSGTEDWGNSSLSDFDEVNEGCALAPTAAGKLWALLHEGHQATYDEETLVGMLKQAGFLPTACGFRQLGVGRNEEARKQILRETLDTHPALSLYVDAVPRVG